jgi:hypothetical protein
VPPAACKLAEYATPLVPEASVAVPIVSWVGDAGDAGAAATAIDITADCVCTGLLLSLTVTVKLKVPVAVGVPVIAPDVAANLRPFGSVPAVTDQLYGDVPPLAARPAL